MTIYYQNKNITIYNNNCKEILKNFKPLSINCIITSPPYYGLRDYGEVEQLGLEETPEKYVENLVEIFREIKRVLRNDGTVWLNLGDSYCGSGVNNGNTNAGISRARKRGDIKKTSRPNTKINNLKPKNLIGIPWRVAFALQADGWCLRQDIIWQKPNSLPESVRDRCTKAHEYIFLLTKNYNQNKVWWAKDTGEYSYNPDLSEIIKDAEGNELPRWRGAQYYFDYESIAEKATGYDGRKDTIFKGSVKYKPDDNCPRPGGERWPNRGKDINAYPLRNKRSVWTVNTQPYKEAHFAVFPDKLIAPCIKAGCPEGGVVLDPFMGSGTTLKTAQRLGRKAIGIDLNKNYCKMSKKRFAQEELF